MSETHIPKPKIGDKFYMNLAQPSFKDATDNAAFKRQEDATESARCWSEEREEPWLVLECRVIDLRNPPQLRTVSRERNFDMGDHADRP